MTWRSLGKSWMRGVAAISAAVALAAAACGYDWSVREGGSAEAGAGADGSTDVDSGGADAAADHVTPTDGAADGPRDGSVSCAQLASTMLQAGNRAQSCALSSNDCKTGKILDECGCGRFPAAPGSNDAVAWQNAIAAYRDAGCLVMSCAGPCSAATSGLCVLQGGMPLCSP